MWYYVKTLEYPINLKGDKSHVRKYVGTKSKKYFSTWLMKYVISNKDLDEIEKYVKNKKDGKADNQLNQKPSSTRLYNSNKNKSTNNKKTIKSCSRTAFLLKHLTCTLLVGCIFIGISYSHLTCSQSCILIRP